jgi:hypothetical protein
MTDRDRNRDVSHAVFGLGDRPEQRTDEGSSSVGGSAASQSAQSPQPPAPWSFSGGQVLFLLIIALLIVSGINLYLILSTRSAVRRELSRHDDQIKLLSRRMDSSDDRYAQLKGQFEVTSQKLGFTQKELAQAHALATHIQQQQRQAVQELSQAIQQKASSEQLNKLQTESTSKFGALSGDITGTQKDLEATKEALTGAKGELSGAIARTHDELVALAHRTDRDYFEFSLPRKHARKKIGSVMIELMKTDTRHNLYTVNLFFDDKRTERRDKALDEPVYFLVEGASSPMELVVNKLAKNSIAGYVSAPKAFFASTPNVLTARPGA